MEEPIFKTVEAALTFAFRYAGQQSPPTPASALAFGKTPGGSGKGLVGLDGAAQAGMILAGLDRLPKEQRWALTVRFGDVRTECRCCGQPAPSAEWQDAVDALGWCTALEGVPKHLRQAMVAKVLCRHRVDLPNAAQHYGLVLRTLYRQQEALIKHLTALERAGLDELRRAFAPLFQAA